MDDPKSDQSFDKGEAKRRFEAALKGARIAGHKPMQSLTRKKTKAQSKKRGKPKAAGG
jgi:hypothetical protein